MRTPANNRGYFQAEIIAKVTTPKKKTHNSTKQKTLNMITFKQADKKTKPTYTKY
jgi:hypothetical protein